MDSGGVEILKVTLSKSTNWMSARDGLKVSTRPDGLDVPLEAIAQDIVDDDVVRLLSVVRIGIRTDHSLPKGSSCSASRRGVNLSVRGVA